nr:hypothetical protein [Waterburya agarophytonicola]
MLFLSDSDLKLSKSFGSYANVTFEVMSKMTLIGKTDLSGNFSDRYFLLL